MYITFHATPPPGAGVPPCPECGMTLHGITKANKLGCPHCYTHFEDRLAPYVRRVHGPGVHNGAIPKSAGGEMAARRRLAELRQAMTKAIEAQEFETCARLRDEISALENPGGEGAEV